MQGGLYQEIMKQVIENSVITFEEEGIEASVLEELRMVSETSFHTCHQSSKEAQRQRRFLDVTFLISCHSSARFCSHIKISLVVVLWCRYALYFFHVLRPGAAGAGRDLDFQVGGSGDFRSLGGGPLLIHF
jgi:hypothetical protein